MRRNLIVLFINFEGLRQKRKASIRDWQAIQRNHVDRCMRAIDRIYRLDKYPRS